MKRKTITVFLVLLLLFGTVTAAAAAGTYEQQVTELVNAQRVQAGLSPLELSRTLSALACDRAQDMQRSGNFSHTDPHYGTAFDRMRAFGVSYRYAGENIAVGYSTPAAVVSAWMQSASHRENILSSRFDTLGVGYTENGSYWVQWFTGT